MAKNEKGPKKFKRDEHGLLESQEYLFKEDGSVDWRAMVSDDHLYPNKDWFESRQKQIPKSVEGLEDYQLLIKLSGIREIANIRGFKNVEYNVVESSASRAVVKCKITFLENYESPETCFESIANATLDNTDNFARKFLESIAENRAFVRCVRAFLNIPIVGADEIDKSQKPEKQVETVDSASFSPQKTLERHARNKNLNNFEDFKSFLREAWKSGEFKSDKVKDWNSFKDIPAKESRVLIDLLNK